MRVYQVNMFGIDTRTTQEIRFPWYVVYPHRPADKRGITEESEREGDAMRQVREMMPHIACARALSSHWIASARNWDE